MRGAACRFPASTMRWLLVQVDCRGRFRAQRCVRLGGSFRDCGARVARCESRCEGYRWCLPAMNAPSPALAWDRGYVINTVWLFQREHKIHLVTNAFHKDILCLRTLLPSRYAFLRCSNCISALHRNQAPSPRSVLAVGRNKALADFIHACDITTPLLYLQHFLRTTRSISIITLDKWI
ncbi:uncharacterized protein CC84DRAFT_432279 [Paraphaeosphaeria sporulosa]|uniref:Uncharacterized protein n=1 Tax=Paraphaeosphaeria sporulosa TaxID=1460663 RepID=A0A177CPQ9_9PLEO|nr:uncharacterized protein CC84DRAFT_432279 [Paraphaeosphaeria sporulosa]OAG09211.1 hypothetical protein CC84DRAFT_432279 [Paraphaeosphaeria sporulosa]